MNSYKFIFDDVIEARKQAEYGRSKKYYENSIKKYIKKYRYMKYILSLYDLVYGRNANNNYELLFVGTKMLDFVNEASKRYKSAVIIRGQRSRKEIDKHKLDTIPGDRWIYEIYKCAFEDKKKIENVILDLSYYLKKINPKFIFLFSNTNFFERAVVLGAKKANIPTIKLQHGMMHHNEYDYRISNISDYIWVWNEYFKKLLVDNTTLKTKQVRVIGYPHNTINKEWPKSIKKICFLGQANTGEEPNSIQKIQVTKFLKDECDKYGLDFCYRPHPGERRTGIIYELNEFGINVTDKKESLKDAFQKYDLFISFFSTALIDAYMNKKYTCQIKMEFKKQVDDFSKLGKAFTISWSNIETLDSILQGVKNIRNKYEGEEELSKRIVNNIFLLNEDKL